MITSNEKELALHCIGHALECGASAVRISLNKNTLDAYTVLNGELDKVSHSADRSIFLYLYADGRYGTFSTNRLEKDELEKFILQAVEMVKMLGEDACRSLPAPERTAKDAASGLELELYDSGWEKADAADRLGRAISMSRYATFGKSDDYEIISEECEWAESCDDTLLMDSQGFEGRHKETSFNCFSEVTVQDREGNRYSGHWWDASPYRESNGYVGCSQKALERAVSQIGPKNRRSGRYRMVVDRTVSSRLVSPLLSALNMTSIQQKVSFLEDSKGKGCSPRD